MIFIPRPYQLETHAQIIEKFKTINKLLLVMSTGAGKSKTIASFVKKYFKHFNWVLVVRKRDLVNQLADTFTEFDLEYGVFMAGDKRYNPKLALQICSIDTLDARDTLPHLTDSKDVILIIDEADESLADGYQKIIKRYTNRNNYARPKHFDVVELMKPIRPAFMLGMTATPYDKPLTHFEDYIEPVKPKELRDTYRALVDFKYFIPRLMDLSNVRVNKGEFNASDLERERNSAAVIAEDFKYWLLHGENRQTLVFCTSQDHAKNVAIYINMYFDKMVAVAVDANTPSEHRQAVYNMFRNGQIKFIVNVRLVTRGVDIIEIGTILDLAPTMSVNNHLQKIGRGSRQNPIYKDCIVIDMANNLVNNGPFYKTIHREVNLTGIKARTKKDLGEMMRVCSTCFRGAEPEEFGFHNICPYCGSKNGKIAKEKLSKAKSKSLQMEGATPEKIEQLGMINEFKKILWQFENLGKRDKANALDNAHKKLIKKYGINQVEKIKGAIKLSDAAIRRHKQIYDYIPLGGL